MGSKVDLFDSSKKPSENTMKKTIALLTFSLLAACASPEVVSERQVGDASLTCSEITSEIREAEKFKERARDEKGMTGKNVAAAVFFWPAMLVTYSNVEEAVRAAEDREDFLLELSDTKKCGL